ncbi:MAG TPA: hypothetical protein VNR66_13825 [Solirubrobacteraceae bacterium]|nr:hypothetical protein [Solirubrobacteraceae bacterium]
MGIASVVTEPDVSVRSYGQDRDRIDPQLVGDRGVDAPDRLVRFLRAEAEDGIDQARAGVRGLQGADKLEDVAAGSFRAAWATYTSAPEDTTRAATGRRSDS